jgi:crossover junction endodeoxyribonuclease RusA
VLLAAGGQAARWIVLPFDFTVDGVPASLQARSGRKAQWKADVARAARLRWPAGAPPITSEVQLRAVYFAEGPAPDVDNMIKPIQDALIGIVYIDDSQVVEATGARRNLNGSFRVRGIPPQLAEAFVRGNEFVYVAVSAPDQENPL